ncbi:MAG TPA: hypothetical protein VF163_07380, partial [Micromonosporaceae bacterium]
MTEVSGSPEAAELARLDRELEQLTAQVEQARQAWLAAQSRWAMTRQHRDELARRLLTLPAAPPLAAPPLAAPPLAGPPPMAAPPSATPASAALPGAAPAQPVPALPVQRPAPEASTRTVQNVLFVLGGLLLGTAAVVFTAVAWERYGVTGRALILAVVTVLALLAPLVALRRRLTATAETFAAVGLLLVVLDGYAAWYVNLAGVTAIPGTRYAAAVGAATALVAAGYQAVTKLVGPAVAAALAVQPILPLLVAERHPSAAGWAATAGAVALLNVGLLSRDALRSRVAPRSRKAALSVDAGPGRTASTRGRAVRVIAWAMHATAVIIGVGTALVAEAQVDDRNSAAAAGLALLVVAAAGTAGAAITRNQVWHALAGCGFTLATVVATARFAAESAPAQSLLVVPAVVTAVVLVAVGLGPLLPAGAGSGARAAAIVSTAGLSLVLVAMSVVAAGRSVSDAWPAGRADLIPEPIFTWRLPVAVALAAVAVAALTRRTFWAQIGVTGGVIALAALPGSVALPWWQPAALDLAGAAVLAGSVLVRPGRPGSVLLRGCGAGVLAVLSILTGLARPELAAGVLAGVAVLGLALGVGSARRDRAVDRLVGGIGLVIGLLAVPAAVAATSIGLGQPTWWVARLSTASVLVVLALFASVGRFSAPMRWYGFGAALAAGALWPTACGLVGDESAPVYAGLALVAIALALLIQLRVPTPQRAAPEQVAGEQAAAGPAGPEVAATQLAATQGIAALPIAVPVAGAAAVPAALLFAVNLVPVVVNLVGLPYAWASSVWTGAPAGVGLAPPEFLAVAGVQVSAASAVALGLLALAAAITALARTGRLTASLAGLSVGGPTAVLAALVAAGQPWPAVPAAMLALGLILTMAAAIAPLRAWSAATAATQGVAYLGAGVAASLPTQWSTLTATGAIVVAATVISVTGRSVGWQVAGALTAVPAALGTAAAASFAAGLAPRSA